MYVCTNGGGVNYNCSLAAPARHMTLYPTIVKSVCPSAELWLIWAQQSQTKKEERRDQAAKGLAVAELIPLPPITTTYTLKHVLPNIWPRL